MSLKDAVRRRFRHKDKSHDAERVPPDPQIHSRLLALPVELQQEIFKYVLARPERAKPAHFHVYDKVYDSCLYDQDPVTAQRERKAATNTALLRTCRRIYHDAVRYLYDDTDFELVVMAGFARPDHFRCPRGATWDNIGTRNCLGSISQLPHLKRMRHVALILQPGRNPDVNLYAARVADVCRALLSAKQLKCLDIVPNLARRDTLFNSEVTPGALEAWNAYYKTLLALSPISSARTCNLSLLFPGTMHVDTLRSLEVGMTYLQTHLGDKRSRREAVEYLPGKGPAAGPGMQYCFDRGAYGAQYDDGGGSTSTVAILSILAVGLILSPILVPIGMKFNRDRKRIKGEVVPKWTAVRKSLGID